MGRTACFFDLTRGILPQIGEDGEFSTGARSSCANFACFGRKTGLASALPVLIFADEQ